MRALIHGVPRRDFDLASPSTNSIPAFSRARRIALKLSCRIAAWLFSKAILSREPKRGFRQGFLNLREERPGLLALFRRYIHRVLRLLSLHPGFSRPLFDPQSFAIKFDAGCLECLLHLDHSVVAKSAQPSLEARDLATSGPRGNVVAGPLERAGRPGLRSAEGLLSGM
jgi:hypothetical protein